MTSATYRNFSQSPAQAYEQFFVPAIATPVATELLQTAGLQPGEAVLDVACGTGLIARLAAAAVGASGSVTGIDVAPEMIEVAAAASQTDGAEIEWLEADAASLPSPDQSYDVVLCQMGLMFVEDKAAAIAEMKRVLRPGGRLVINTPGRIQPPFEEMERAIADHIDPELGGFVRAVFSMHDPDALEILLTEAGLDGVATSEYEAQLDLPAPAEFLWQYINLTPMAPLVAKASDTAKAAMEAQVVETWASWVSAGRVALAQPIVLASARRG
ncbi:MAG: methyltransferase domain-containing protein [Acidimicrobiia bacterium]|nr:methyltransferase domain-containing protein [Acidimicrobiia bacterium]MDH5238269.1 methyltransferase domain-containing protein [Acidimicrobiia bacterium]